MNTKDMNITQAVEEWSDLEPCDQILFFPRPSIESEKLLSSAFIRPNSFLYNAPSNALLWLLFLYCNAQNSLWS